VRLTLNRCLLLHNRSTRRSGAFTVEPEARKNAAVLRCRAMRLWFQNTDELTTPVLQGQCREASPFCDGAPFSRSGTGLIASGFKYLA
jgi:hypothetical protein